MTPPRIVVGTVVVVALTVACTRPDVTATTEPLAPPDTLTPRTTTSTRPRTTTTVHVDRAKIYPVDPITLEAVAGFDPIPMGDWAWGMSSKNGSWLAMTVGYDERNSTELRLIDVDNWTVATTWLPSIDNPLSVTDEGAIYVINGSNPSYHLSRMVPGEISPVVVADLPEHFYWNELHIVGQRAMIFGFVSPNDDDTGEAVLVTVDLATGATGEVALPGVEVGVLGYLALLQNGDTPFFAFPTVLWDDARSRMLLVEANREVVTEVETTTGEVTEHQFGTAVLDSAPSVEHPFVNGLRSAALGRPNGRVLYLASGIQTFEVIDDYLTTTFDPLGIEVIDTETWEVIDRLDAPITEVYLSSDGNRLLATGQFYEDKEDNQQSGSYGLYVIDAANLDVIAHLGADEPDRYYWGLSMNPGMPLGYVQSYDQASNIDVVNLDVGTIVASRLGSEIQLLTEAAVLVDTTYGTS